MFSVEVKIPDLSLVNKRIVSGDIIGVSSDFHNTLAALRVGNPGAELVETYKEFASHLPYFVTNDVTRSIFHAIACSHPKLAKAGRAVMTLINMKTILSASEPFLTGVPEEDEDIIQSGFEGVLRGMSLPSFREGMPTSVTTFIHGRTETGIAEFLFEKEEIPLQLVSGNSNPQSRQAVEQIKEYFEKNPYAQLDSQIDPLIDKIAGNRVRRILVRRAIQARNSQFEDDRIIDEDDMLEPIARTRLRQDLETVLNQIPPRNALAVACEFGLITTDSEDLITRSGVAKRLGNITEERVRQLIRDGLKKIRDLYGIKASLFPYLHPEQIELWKFKPLASYLEFELDKTLLEKYVKTEIYRTVYTRGTFEYFWYVDRRFGKLPMDPETVKALYEGGIHSLPDLLSKPIIEIAEVPGIDEERLDEIMSLMKNFLIRNESAS